MSRNQNSHKHSRYSAENGSALIYILVAIALFSALSFVMSQSMRGGDSGKNEELLQLQATEILQYVNGLQRALRSMRIEGLEFSALSFENNIVAGYGHAGCSTDDCKLFNINGGGMAYQTPVAEDWLDGAQGAHPLYGEWYFPGDLCVLDVGSDTGAGCSSDGIDNEDVVIILPWIKENLCVQINQDLGITTGGEPIPTEGAGDAWNSDDRKFDGTTGDGETLDQGGRRYGCFEGTSTNNPPAGSYHFFQVLWAR